MLLVQLEHSKSAVVLAYHIVHHFVALRQLVRSIIKAARLDASHLRLAHKALWQGRSPVSQLVLYRVNHLVS